jgi:hypothetical protein
VLALGFAALDASAAPIIFDFAGSGSQFGGSKTFTVDGVTLTLSNPSGSFSQFVQSANGFYVTLGSGGFGNVNLSFSSDVKVTHYNVVNSFGSTLGFNLTGGNAGAASSLNNSLAATGTFALSSLYTINAGQTGAFAGYQSGPAASYWKGLTVETLGGGTGVPEIDALAGTGALTLLGFGLALVGERRRHAG